MMSQLIICLVVVFVVLLTWKFFKPEKRKKVRTMPPVEKVVHTLKYRWQQSLKDLNDSMRSPEVVANEIEQILDEAYEQRSLDFKKALKDIVHSLQSLRSTRENLERTSESLDKTLKEQQQAYRDDPQDYIAHAGAETQKNIQKVREYLATIADRIAALEKRQGEVEFQCNTFASSFEIKRSDIRMMVLNRTLGTTVNTSVDIDDLVNEFQIKAQDEDIEMKVDNMMQHKTQETVSSEDTQAFIASCK